MRVLCFMPTLGALAFASVAVLWGTPVAAADAHPVLDLHGLNFSSPIAFSAPAPTGLNALLIVHPADAKTGGEKMSLTAAAFPADSGMNDAELLEYVKTVFLATSAPGRPLARTLLGKSVTGQALEKKIPAPSHAEIYVVTNKNGDKVVLGFVFSPGFTKEAEEAIVGIAASMKE